MCTQGWRGAESRKRIAHALTVVERVLTLEPAAYEKVKEFTTGFCQRSRRLERGLGPDTSQGIMDAEWLAEYHAATRKDDQRSRRQDE
jgi:hypothetical protein